MLGANLKGQYFYKLVNSSVTTSTYIDWIRLSSGGCVRRQPVTNVCFTSSKI